MSSINKIVQDVFIASSQNGIDITFQNITYSVEIEDPQQESMIPCSKKFIRKQLLKDVSGIFKAGEISAIMGASGAGKTTLLNVLACRVPSKLLEGKIYANDTEYNFENFGDFANYVMQADLLLQTLTVRETLQFVADLKLDISDEAKKERINDLANNLKLQKCLDVLVGGPVIKGISGGQKKRTSIAFQLISDPQVLILDEPTSGLDSLTSFIIVGYLQKLAKSKKKTIFMTIHQPNSEIFELFDRLMLLVDGKIIYQGNREKAVVYFDRNFGLSCPEFANPADYFMSIMHQQDPENKNRLPKYIKCYENQIAPQITQEISQKNRSDIQKRQVAISTSKSLKTLINRDFINVLRNPMLSTVRIIQNIFIAVYIAGLFARFSGEYVQEINWFKVVGFFFFMAVNLMMMSLVPVTLIFPQQRPIFLKEQGSKLYSVTSYFLSRNIIQIPYSFIFPLITALIMYWFVGLSNTASQFFTFYLITYLIGFAGSSMGLMLGSIIQDAKSVSTSVFIIMLPFFVLSGLFKNQANMPLWYGWFQYISPIKYAFTSFISNEVQYASVSRLSELNFDTSLWGSIGLLAATGIAFQLISLFFLWLLRAKLE